MKRNISLRFFLALMAGMLIIAISGCDNSTSPNVDISDDPAQGFMSKATADAIFEWTTEKNGVRIGKFRNADALRSYLAGITRAAASPTSLVINRINGMPVTSIAEGAFSPAAGAADITTVVSTITLPETITSLGADLFAGASQPVTVDIPPAVADKISQPALEAAAGGKATIQKVDPSGEPQVIVQGPSSGSSGGSGSTGPSGPAAPSIAVLSGNAELTVTWAAVSGATGYEVYYHTSNTTTGATKLSPDPTATTATITGLSNNTLYYVWARTKTAAGTSDYSTSQGAAPYNPSLLNDFAGVWDSYSDGYVISTSHIEYDDGYPNFHADFEGDIKYIHEYSTNAGVIIVKYTEVPGSSYTKGTSNYEGIYYQKPTGGIKLANAFDADTATNIQDLAAAITKFSQANEATLVNTYGGWSGVYVQYKQSGTVIDMGALRGTWQGDDDLSTVLGPEGSPTTMLKINDYRLTVYMGPISPVTPAYSGAIVERTDPSLDTGFIYIQFTQEADSGLVELIQGATEGDYYAIYWYTDSGKIYFSVYNDHYDVAGSDLNTLKGLTNLNPYFLEADDSDYEGDYGGMIGLIGGDEYVYVGFTKQ